MGLADRLSHAWNVFKKPDKVEPEQSFGSLGSAYSPTRRSMSYLPNVGDKNLIEELINKIAIHVGKVEFVHARLDDNDRYIDVVHSGLQYCFNDEANVDQGPTHFKIDIATRLLTDGVVAIVPVETSVDPLPTGSFDIKTLRAGRITEWYPRHVKIDLYDDRTGEHREVMLPKKMVAIVENPHYAIMNKPNSSFQRLMRKLTALDAVDNEYTNKKLDLIIKLPYTVKSERRRAIAEQKRKDLEHQLTQSEIGVGYIDATDNITQLNRSVENDLMNQVEYFMADLYSKLGITQAFLEGSADQQQMLNFQNQTLEPILDSIVEEVSRKFLTRTARTQKQRVIYQRKPYKIVPMNDLAEMGDKFTRNEIMTANEVRSWVGLKPVDDPHADELRNANMPREDTEDNTPDRQNGKEEDEA